LTAFIFFIDACMYLYLTPNPHFVKLHYILVLKRIYQIFGYLFVNVFIGLQTNIRLFIV